MTKVMYGIKDKQGRWMTNADGPTRSIKKAWRSKSRYRADYLCGMLTVEQMTWNARHGIPHPRNGIGLRVATMLVTE